MPPRAQHHQVHLSQIHEERQHWRVSTALGNGARACVPQSVAHHLLVVAVPHLVDNAAHAIVFESRWLYDEGQVPIGAYRQCNLLWIVFVDLRRFAGLHCHETGRGLGLAEVKGNRFVGVEYLGIVFADSAVGWVLNLKSYS